MFEQISKFQMSLNVLTKIANDSSLRYAIQLITPAALQAKRRNHKQVTTEDIRKVEAPDDF